MIRCLFKKTKKIDGDEYPSNDFRSLWSDFEKRLYKEKEHYRVQSYCHFTRIIELSKEMEDKDAKFKSVMERLREEKWELEMENEFLRKKIKEMK